MRTLQNTFLPFGAVVLIFFATLFVVACNGKEPVPAPQVLISVETLDASDVAQTDATLNGKLELSGASPENLEYGFYWGTSEEVQDTYVKGGPIAENAYSAMLTGLSPEAQYWYKAYLKVDGQTYYGEVKSFTTVWNPVTGVTLDKTKFDFHNIRDSWTLTPTVSPSDASDKSVSWQSTDESVATVDQTGKMTAIGNGEATITVTTNDRGKTATSAVTVAQWVTSIKLNRTSLSLLAGEDATLSVKSVLPDSAADENVSRYRGQSIRPVLP